jgi:HK97 family phage major capsid protein
MSIQAMREERTEKAREYRNILDKNPGDLTDEIKDSLDSLMSDIDRIDDRISREEAILAKVAEERVVEQVQDAASRKDTPHAVLFAKWLKGGDKAMSAEDWQTIRATMSTGTDSEGGYTVQSEVAGSVIEALKEFGGMREVATVISTSQGNPMNWPTSDGTSEEGEIVAENASATDEDVSFGTKALPVYKFSSKVIPVPIELLQDSSVDIEAFVRGRIVQRLGRTTNKYFTVGTGSSQPTGIVAGSSEGAVALSGQVDSILYDDLVNLEHSVDPAYRRFSARWMFHDQTLKALKKLKDGQGRPLWLPDVAGSAPAQIMGYGYTINQDVAQMAANAKSVLFGRFSDYVIRDVMAFTFYRFTDSAYAKKGQVGFLAFMRSGGNLMDVGGAVKHFRNAAS